MAPWLAENWFDVMQTAGVAGSLLFAGLALRFDARVRRTEVVLSLTEAHREIWERLIEQPSLGRILEASADTSAVPPDAVERRFVQLVILHLAAVRQAVSEGAYRESPGTEEDVRDFLRLPIPRLVAREILPFQPEEFQAYLRTMME
jgi:hypothetical protein